MNDLTFTHRPQSSSAEAHLVWELCETLDDGNAAWFADISDELSAKVICNKLNTLLSENADLRDRVATMEAGNESLRNNIDCACNALTDSICVSGNDMGTNLHFVHKLKAVIQPPTEQKV